MTTRGTLTVLVSKHLRMKVHSFDRDHRAEYQDGIQHPIQVQLHGKTYEGQDALAIARYQHKPGRCRGCDVILRNSAAASLRMMPANVVEVSHSLKPPPQSNLRAQWNDMIDRVFKFAY